MVAAGGGPKTYQWMVNPGTGFTNLSDGGCYSGVNQPTLNIGSATSALSNYQYMCVVTSNCNSVSSTAAILSVPYIQSSPSNVNICAGNPTTFTVSAIGAALSYQWQYSTNLGVTWTNVTNGGSYSNATTPTLTINPVLIGYDQYYYQCAVTSGGCSTMYSGSAILYVIGSVAVVSQVPLSTAICAGGTGTMYAVMASGTYLTFQWQVSTDGGTTWTNLSDGGVYFGSAMAQLWFIGAPATMNGYKYRCNISNGCGTITTPGSAPWPTLTVYSLPTITSGGTVGPVCYNAGAQDANMVYTATTNAPNSYSIAWTGFD